eukprot:403345463
MATYQSAMTQLGSTTTNLTAQQIPTSPVATSITTNINTANFNPLSSFSRSTATMTYTQPQPGVNMINTKQAPQQQLQQMPQQQQQQSQHQQIPSQQQQQQQKQAPVQQQQHVQQAAQNIQQQQQPPMPYQQNMAKRSLNTQKSNPQLQQQQQQGISNQQDNQQEKQLVGIQAQNLYLLNYMNKLEFLLQEQIKERKRCQKKREKQMELILKAIGGDKPAISKDIPTLKYYLGITHGVDDKFVDKLLNDSDAEQNQQHDNIDSDPGDCLQKRLFAKNPAEEQLNRDDQPSSQLPGASDSHEQKSSLNLNSQDKKPYEMRMQAMRAELPSYERKYDKEKFNIDTSDSSCLQTIDSTNQFIMKQKMQQADQQNGGNASLLGKRTERNGVNADGEGEDSIDEYQVSDFMKNEWKYLAKLSSKLK